MEGVELVVQRRRRDPIASFHGVLELGAKARRDVGGDRDAADPAHRVEAQGHIVIAGKLDEIRAAGGALGGDAARLPVASLTPITLAVFESRPIVSTEMSVTVRDGTL